MPVLNPSWDALTVTSDGVTCLKPCRDIVFYWTGSVFDRAAGIIEFYRRSLALLRPHATFFRTETMRGAQPLKKDSLELVPFWLGETKTRRETYMLYLESGRVADEPSDTAFYLQALEYGAMAKGYVRLILPVVRQRAAGCVRKSCGVFVERSWFRLRAGGFLGQLE
jgi:hypothetical protein